MTADEQIITLDVDRDESVENVKALLEVETQVRLQRQQLLYNGKEMNNSQKLSVLGVKDDDLIMMVSNAASAPRLGESGTYYGVRFVKNIPGFPFGVIKDPQYNRKHAESCCLSILGSFSIHSPVDIGLCVHDTTGIKGRSKHACEPTLLIAQVEVH